MKTKKKAKKPFVIGLQSASNFFQGIEDQMLIDSLGDETETFEPQPPMNPFQAMLAGKKSIGIKE